MYEERTLTKQERIVEYLVELNTDSLIEIHNTICFNQYNYEDRIYENAPGIVNELLYGLSPWEIVEKVAGNLYKTTDDYFVDGIYDFESFNDPLEKIDIEAMAAYMVDYDEDGDDYEIREILDEEEDSEILEWLREHECSYWNCRKYCEEQFGIELDDVTTDYWDDEIIAWIEQHENLFKMYKADFGLEETA